MDHNLIRWDRVRRLTFVPFLADGRCALMPADDGLRLPSGEVLAGDSARRALDEAGWYRLTGVRS